MTLEDVPQDGVIVEDRTPIAVIRLNSPKRSNAITSAMAEQLISALQTIGDDSEMKTLVLASSGRSFSAGADLSLLRGALSTPVDDQPIRRMYDVIAALLAVPLPVLCAVEGTAVGAGLNLVLACDVRIAGASATFDSRFLRVGLHPGGGHAWLLLRSMNYQHAAQLMLCGGIVDARRAAEIGLVTSVVNSGSAELEALRLANETATIPRELLVEAKRTLRRSAEVSFMEASELELRRQLEMLDLPDVRNALNRALEKRGG